MFPPSAIDVIDVFGISAIVPTNAPTTAGRLDSPARPPNAGICGHFCKRGPFVVDEADDAFVDNPDLRQVINSGWTRGQGVMRCDPDTNEPRRFSTFCPKAIALKGKKMPDTMLSRTIFIEMKRRLRSEKVDHFRPP